MKINTIRMRRLAVMAALLLPLSLPGDVMVKERAPAAQPEIAGLIRR